MSEKLNGSEAAPMAAEETAPAQAPEFPFVRNVVGAPGGATELVYNFHNGQYAGTVTVRVVTPEVLGPVGEDFMHFTRQVLEQVKATQEQAQARRNAPGLQVVPADALRGMKRPT